MKKIILSLVLAVMLVSLMAVPVFAGPMGKEVPANDVSSSLYLYEKDADWVIVDGGAWGKLSFSLSGEGEETAIAGVFNGKGLVPGVCYALINYPEPTDNPWGGNNPQVLVIGMAEANGGGNVNIAGSAVIGYSDSMPDADMNDEAGDKIWLVTCDSLTAQMEGDDIVGYTMTGWTPAAYLFEHNLINTGNTAPE